MSWLYSILFAGLVFSSGNEAIKPKAVSPAAPPVTVMAPQGDERERMEQSYPITPNGRVSVSNINGSITVESWDRNEIRLEAVKIADSKEALADVQIKVNARADAFSVEADYNDWRRGGEKTWKNRGKLEVQFRLSVPKGAVLDEIETVNGSVTVANFANVTKVSAVNGNVTATNLRGTANLSTVNGEVAADFDRLESGSRISLSTVNGRVNLTIPSDANATVKAESLNGEIKNDFGLPVRKGQFVGRNLYGRVGSGEIQIRLESVNGPLTVQRKNDGKSPNPATNLLQKSKDEDEDDNWGDDDTSFRPNVKVNPGIANAVAESTRAAAAGIRVAIPELERIPAEIEKIKDESLKINAEELEKATKELEKLKVEPDIKIQMDKLEMKRKVRESVEQQREAMRNMRRVGGTGRNPFIEKKTNSFAVTGVPTVTLDAKGCAVSVRSWNKSEVKYVLTEMENRGRPSASVSETVTKSAVRLKVMNTEQASRDLFFDDGGETVRIEVFVPQKTNLKVITNGEIRLDGVSGDIDLSGVDEPIDVRNADGRLKLSAADGQVRVIGFDGELESNIGEGDVYLEGNFGRVTGRAGGGRFILTVPSNYNADVISNVETLSVENLDAPKPIRERQWRFGSGGPKLNFTVSDGEVIFRNANTLTTANTR